MQRYQRMLRRPGVVAAAGAMMLLATLAPQRALASASASDNASNDNIGSGVNGGTGFAAWSSPQTGGGGGVFTGSSTANGNHTSPGIDTSSKSWGMYCNGSTVNANYSRMSRLFTAGTTPSAVLQPNQTFTIDMDNGFVATSGIVGFSLQNSSGNDVFSFKFIGGGSSFQINGATPSTSIGYTKTGLRVKVTLTSSTAYTVSAYEPNTSSTVIGPNTGSLMNPTGGQSIDRVILYTDGTGSGSDYDMFFNSMGISCPSFTVTAPTSQTVCLGSTASFAVTASAASTPTYLWQFSTDNGTTWIAVTNGTGLTAATYTTAATTSAMNNYQYRCAVTDACGTTLNSSAATLTVNATSVGGTATATATHVCTGSGTTVTVSGYTGTIQWQQSANGSTGWAAVTGGSGATSATYTTPNLTSTTYYRAVVTSGVCSAANSTTASVSVDPASVGGTATATSSAVCVGASTTINLTGNTGSTIQWQQSADGSTGWATVTGGSGGTTATYTTPGLTSKTYYRAVVTSGTCSSANSSVASVDITANPAVTGQPTNTTVCQGSTASFTVGASGVNSYQWQYSTDSGSTWNTVSDGTGQTGATYTTPALSDTSRSGYQYRCHIVGCGGATADSDGTATLTVNPTSVGGTATPDTASFCASGSTTVRLTGSTGSIQWQASPDNTTFTNISGATSANYNTPTLTATNYYRAVVTSGVCGAANSTVATVSVSPSSVGGTATAGTTSFCGSGSTTITLTGSTGTIQWYASTDGSTYNSISGATSATYTTPTLTQTTYYRATVTSGVCSAANSTVATVTINSAPSSPSVSISPSASVCAGNAATFSVSTTGGSPTGYAWRKRDPSAGWGAGNNWAFSYNSGSCDGYNGVFIGSATASGQSPGINNNGKAFGLYANNWNAAEAKRDFGGLATGQDISFDMQIPVTLTGNNGSGQNSQALFALRNSTNESNPRLEIWVLAGASYLTISDGTGDESATVPYDSNGYHCVFTLTGQNTYNLTVKRLSTSVIYTYTGRSLKGTANDAVNQLRAWLKNYDSAGGSAEDFYINNLVAGAFEDTATNYTAGGCASTTWTTSPNLGFGPVASSASYVISSPATTDSGSYDVLVWDACGQAFASPVTLTVNAIPSAPTAGNDSPVYGSTLHLTASTVSGATYAWSGPNGFSSSAQNPTIAGVTMADSGTYSVTATVNGCPSAAGTTVVTINQASTTNDVAASPNPSLPGASVTFTATVGAVAPGAGTPTGTVLFKTNGIPLSDPVSLDGSGVATLVTNCLPHGSNTVTAEYAGDSNFLGLTNSVIQVVNTPPTAPSTNAGVTENQALVFNGAKLLTLCHDADGDALTLTSAGPTSTNGGTVTLTGGNITYQPVTNFVGTDLFTFVVSDPYGASGTGTVVVAVSATNVPSPNIVAGPSYDSGSGTFSITFAGIPGYTYTIQSADSPTGPWSFLKTATAGTDGLFEVTDTELPPPPARYYRTMYP